MEEEVELIKSSGDIEHYLIPEVCVKYHLGSEQITSLVEELENKEKYGYTSENKEIGMYELIKATDDVEKYISSSLSSNTLLNI